MKKWLVDPHAEQAMRKLGVRWEVEEVPLRLLDWEASLANHARVGQPIDPEHVAAMETAIASGDSLPMPVLLRAGKQFVVFGGNHRLQGAKRRGLETVSAYVFESSDDLVLKCLQRALNPPVLATAREHRMRFAADAVATGMSRKDAASLFTVEAKTLESFIREEELRGELMNQGVPCEQLPAIIIKHLWRIQKNANVLNAAARLIVAGRLNGEEADRFTRDIQKERTEAQQLAVVAKMEKELALQPPQGTNTEKQSRPKRTRILMALGAIEKHLSVRTVNQWGFTDKHEKARLIERLENIARSIQKIIKKSR